MNSKCSTREGRWFGTSGLGVAFLLTANTGDINVLGTADLTPEVAPVVEEYREEETRQSYPFQGVVIKIRQRFSTRAFYELLKIGDVQCLPANIFIVRQEHLEIFERLGIPYELV